MIWWFFLEQRQFLKLVASELSLSLNFSSKSSQKSSLPLLGLFQICNFHTCGAISLLCVRYPTLFFLYLILPLFVDLKCCFFLLQCYLLELDCHTLKWGNLIEFEVNDFLFKRNLWFSVCVCMLIFKFVKFDDSCVWFSLSFGFLLSFSGSINVGSVLDLILLHPNHCDLVVNFCYVG